MVFNWDNQPCQASPQMQTDARTAPDPAARPAAPRPGSVETPAAAARTLQNEPQRWKEQIEWQESLLSRSPAYQGAFQALSVQHEGLQPDPCMRRNDSTWSCVSTDTVSGPMPPSAWLGSNRPWLDSSLPSPQPPPPQQPPPPLLPRLKLEKKGDALPRSYVSDFAHALSLALGVEGGQAAALPKRAAAGDAAADWLSAPSMASKRTRHT